MAEDDQRRRMSRRPGGAGRPWRCGGWPSSPLASGYSPIGPLRTCRGSPPCPTRAIDTSRGHRFSRADRTILDPHLRVTPAVPGPRASIRGPSNVSSRCTTSRTAAWWSSTTASAPSSVSSWPSCPVRKFVILAPYPTMKPRIALTAWTRIDTSEESRRDGSVAPPIGCLNRPSQVGIVRALLLLTLCGWSRLFVSPLSPPTFRAEGERHLRGHVDGLDPGPGEQTGRDGDCPRLRRDGL